MRLRLEQRDIDTGEANDCGKCPLARAILRQVLDIELIEVDTDFIRLEMVCGGVYKMKTPDACAAAIQLIDDGRRKEVGEFSFELPIDEELKA